MVSLFFYNFSEVFTFVNLDLITRAFVKDKYFII